MKTLANKTVLVALAMAVWGTPALAATVELASLSVSASEKDTHRATAATAPTPLYALSRLDAETLAGQQMADQELKAIEGTYIFRLPPDVCKTPSPGGPIPIPYPNIGTL